MDMSIHTGRFGNACVELYVGVQKQHGPNERKRSKYEKAKLKYENESAVGF